MKPAARRAPASRSSLAVAALRVVLRRLGAVAVLAAFVSASFASGRAYVWCSMMDEVVPTCCCAGDDDDQASSSSTPEGPAVRLDCCQQRAEPGLPSIRLGAPVADIAPPQRAFVAAAQPFLPRASLTSLPLRRVEPPSAARQGPARAGPRFASDACALLQVFRC